MSDLHSAASNADFQQQTRAIGEVVLALASGDFTRKIHLGDASLWNNERLKVAAALNDLVDQLNLFAYEATRVSRETGTGGKSGGQMEVEGEQGTWKDLTANINLMVANLTSQLRDIGSVVTSIANGDLSHKVRVGAQGEVLLLKDTINKMAN
jgi:HAMP domain-containing protein